MRHFPSRIFVIADTHNIHSKLTIPACDILIHCGDFSMRGYHEEIDEFTDWLNSLTQCKEKIVVAGNHDIGLDNNMFDRQYGRWGNTVEEEKRNDAVARFKRSCTYLENSGKIVRGLYIWGSPYTPWISPTQRWAFQRARGNMASIWTRIPSNLDILITHGPPAGILDANVGGESCGDQALREAVEKMSPRYHLFGHIHQSAGALKKGGTTFVNAAVMDDEYELRHTPRLMYVSSYRGE